MTSEETSVRLTVNEPDGESIVLGVRETRAPSAPSAAVPSPPAVSAPSPAAPAPSAPPASPTPPDPTLSVLGNPSKMRAVVPDAPSFQHVPLSPSMNVPSFQQSSAPPLNFDESSLPLPGMDFQLPPEWGTGPAEPSPQRHDDPWDTGTEEPKTIHLPDPEAQARALQKERNDLLFKLDCLRKQGVEIPKKFNYSSSIDEMRSVYERFHRSQQMDSGLQISRKLLIGFTGLVEWANHRFDPMGVKLDGWSTNIMANVEDFDHALIRVWERYGSAIGEINPILELVFALAMSGVMYHFTQRRIDEELRNQEVDRENPAFQEEVQRVAAEMFQRRQSQRPRPEVPPSRPPPSRSPPGDPVYTNPEKARRDLEQQELREQRAAAALRRQESIRSFEENRNAPVHRPPTGAAFNPAGLLSGMMGSGGGTQEIQEMMSGMGMGPQGFEMPNFVPPTPAPDTPPATPPPVTTIPDPPPPPEYNVDDVLPPRRRRGRPKNTDKVEVDV